MANDVTGIGGMLQKGQTGSFGGYGQKGTTITTSKERKRKLRRLAYYTKGMKKRYTTEKEWPE